MLRKTVPGRGRSRFLLLFAINKLQSGILQRGYSRYLVVCSLPRMLAPDALALRVNAILTYPVDGIPLNSAGYVDRENPRRLVHLKHTPTCMRSVRRVAGPGSAWVGSICAYPVGNEWLHILRQRPETG